jgi:hypothetical protein
MSALFGRIEEAALARYSTGWLTGKVLMAQTEKYMLLKKRSVCTEGPVP